MKNIKRRLISIIVFILLILCISSCKKPEESKEIQLSIISINDFHGQLEEQTDGSAGAARIGSFINEIRGSNPEGTVLLAAGDMFQGTGISNVGYGLDVVNFMNMVDFDAMTIGNHEFDWGLDTVLKYRDGNLENGEAEFPFLSSNIYQKSIEDSPKYIDDYTIIERQGIKIAIIGYIGYDQVNDIATGMIQDYEFLKPYDIVKEKIKKVRTEEKADVVIICCHDDDPGINSLLANGVGEYEVDAIINAHTHDIEASRIYRPQDGRYVTVVQSSSSGSMVGLTTLTFNKQKNDVTEAATRNYPMVRSRTKSSEVETFVSSIIEKYQPIFGRELCVAGTNISKIAGASWAASALFNYANKELGDFDIAFINSGGIRTSAFPFTKGQVVTVNDAYKIMPFDNTIKTTRLLGKHVISIINISEVLYFGNISFENGQYFVNGVLINEEAYYNVVAIDYIFDKPSYPFKHGVDTIATGIYFRDAIIYELDYIGQNNMTWLGENNE